MIQKCYDPNTTLAKHGGEKELQKGLYFHENVQVNSKKN